MDGSQYALLNDNYSLKRLWVADCPAAFTVALVSSKVLASSEGCRQRLTLLGEDLRAKAFLVKSAVQVIAPMCIPIPITAWVHHKYLALARAADPHRQPKLRPVPQCHCVFLFAGDRLKFHQSNLQAALTTSRRVIEHTSTYL